MSSNHKGNGKKTAIPTVWKKRIKPFLFLEMILALTAIILAIINLVRWNTDLPLISSLVTLLVGAVFVLRGVESRLNKEKEYNITFGFGLLICIVSIVPLVKYL